MKLKLNNLVLTEDDKTYIDKYLTPLTSEGSTDKTTYLYWIRTVEDSSIRKNILTKGYIGISSNWKRRYKQHKTKPSSSVYSFLNSGSIEQGIEVLAEGDLREILSLERFLRPSPNIGLNKSVGGGNFPRLSPEGYKARGEKGGKTRLENGFYDQHKASERGKKGHKTKLQSGYYQSDQFKEKMDLRANNLKSSGYYQSDIFKEGIKKAVAAKRESGFYDFKKASERGKKASQTLRDNGFYDSNKPRDRALKSHKTKVKNNYYTSEKFKEGIAKSAEATKRNNVEYNRTVKSIDLKGVEKEYLNYYLASEAHSTEAYCISSAIKRNIKHKGYKWELVG